MFWGLELEPGKKYKQTVEKSFHVSMACLRLDRSPDTGYISFLLKSDNTDFVLCHLHKEKAVQVQLDLNFSVGDEIIFHTRGARNNVMLSGYLIEDDDGMIDDDDMIDDEMLDTIEEESDNESIPVLQESGKLTRTIEIKRTGSESKMPIAAKRAKVEDESSSDDEEEEDDGDEDETLPLNGLANSDDSEEEEESDESDDDEDDDDDLSPAKAPKGKQNTPQKQTSSQSAIVNGKSPAATNTPKAKAAVTPNVTLTPKKQTLEGGVVVQDTKVGSGPPAKSGKMVTVYYCGRLKSTNKQFDATQSGAGFKFRLGRGEVIKGWDIGLCGMKVGGKRTVTIPPALAYGNKGAPPSIPPNSSLVFDIELKNVS